MNLSTKAVIFLLLYFLLSTMLSFWAGSISFIIGGLVYPLILMSTSLFVDQEIRLSFLKVTCGFLLFYSIFIVITHYLFIENPFQNYYVNIDETGFYLEAIILAKFDFAELWQSTFTKLQYSGSPLFYAWIGSLQKIVGLDRFYGLLFQKLNVAFWGSFIPGIVYLLCKRVTVDKNALKAATVYGFFSFVFIYSVAFMRDVHIALIYGIALYIITGRNYSIKSFFLLLVLGLLAYYIRMENGVFFLCFIAIWIYKSGSRNKLLLIIGSAVAIAGVIFTLGGLETIYQMAFSTIENYRERAIERAGQDSLGLQLMYMPVPLNYIGITAFGQIGPFPFWVAFRDDVAIFKNLFYLPEILAGLLWFLVWFRIAFNWKQALKFYQRYKWVMVLAISYIFLVSMGQPGARRLMAVYPIIFTGYIYIDRRVFKSKEIFIGSLIYLSLIIVYWFLKI